jgi:hypothetical protein
MLLRQKLIISLALVLFTASAGADSVYVVNLNQQFGTVDAATGSFSQIGPNTPEGGTGLVPGPNGSLLTLTFSGNLDSINPATGVTSVVGPTGLADCTSPASPCGPTSPGVIGKLGATIFVTDFSNNLYTVNPTTGAATLIGPTGMPPLPFGIFDVNSDGTTNLYEQTLFAAQGKLYSTYDAARIDFVSSTVTPVIPAALYQIDPSTGIATFLAPTALNLTAATDVNGTIYAFNSFKHQVVTLDLTSGNTNFVSDLDPATGGVILGASPVPEPTPIMLAGIGIACLGLYRRRRRNGVVCRAA